MYHVVTMMASENSDGLKSSDLKKRHIGNNLVNIIFNESPDDFDIHTFSVSYFFLYQIIFIEIFGFFSFSLGSI